MYMYTHQDTIGWKVVSYYVLPVRWALGILSMVLIHSYCSSQMVHQAIMIKSPLLPSKTSIC